MGGLAHEANGFDFIFADRQVLDGEGKSFGVDIAGIVVDEEDLDGFTVEAGDGGDPGTVAGRGEPLTLELV